jgi:hypothetical protein
MLRWTVATDGSSLSLNSSRARAPRLKRETLLLPVGTLAGQLACEFYDAWPRCFSWPAAEERWFLDETPEVLVGWREVERRLLMWIAVSAYKGQRAIPASQEVREHRPAYHQGFELAPTALRVVVERRTR